MTLKPDYAQNLVIGHNLELTSFHDYLKLANLKSRNLKVRTSHDCTLSTAAPGLSISCDEE
jgi:hypothetical protein